MLHLKDGNYIKRNNESHAHSNWPPLPPFLSLWTMQKSSSCTKLIYTKAFYDRPVGRRPGLNGSAFSRRLFGRGCKCHTSNHLQPRLFCGFTATAVDRLPVGRHFKNILSVRGGDKGGPIFYSISWGFNSIWVDFFSKIFLSPGVFAYRRTLLGALLSKIYKYCDWRLLASRSTGQSKSIIKTAATEIVLLNDCLPFANHGYLVHVYRLA